MVLNCDYTPMEFVVGSLEINLCMDYLWTKRQISQYSSDKYSIYLWNLPVRRNDLAPASAHTQVANEPDAEPRMSKQQ